MKRIICLFIIFSLFSCNNERVLQLPEIENAEITEVLDVSPAYVFYDETQQDSTFFNRKNLIGTTNWLVNVDKRLTLTQVIPHIQYLQEKRKKVSMHKNENAKNYFTCNDTSIGNLGFVEFTDVNYIKKDSSNYWAEKNQLWKINHLEIHFIDSSQTFIEGIIDNNQIQSKIRYAEFIGKIYNIIKNDTVKLVTNYNYKLSFQNYISIKSELLKLSQHKIIIDNNEFIY